MNPNATQDKARIAELIQSMRQLVANRPVWQPTQRGPFAVIHERQDHENKLRSMTTQIKLGGGAVRAEYE